MSSYSEGQAHQLMNALEAAGFTPFEITQMGQSGELGKYREVLHGRAEITRVVHRIDLDADPDIEMCYTLAEHRKGGQFEWDTARVALYQSREQKNGGFITGHELSQTLRDRAPFNVNMMNYLLKHQNLIPEIWKGKFITFMGTIVRSGILESRYVFQIAWIQGKWECIARRLDNEMGSRSYALILARD